MMQLRCRVPKTHFFSLVPGIKKRYVPLNSDSEDDADTCVVDPEKTPDNVPSMKLRMNEDIESRARRPAFKLRKQLIKGKPGWIKREAETQTGGGKRSKQIHGSDTLPAEHRGIKEVLRLLVEKSKLPRLEQSRILMIARNPPIPSSGRALAHAVVSKYLDASNVNVGALDDIKQVRPICDLLVLAFKKNIEGKIKAAESKNRFFEIDRFEAAERFVTAANRLLENMIEMAHKDILLPTMRLATEHQFSDNEDEHGE